MKITIEEAAGSSHRSIIFDLLEGYNASQVGDEPELPPAVLIRDDASNVVGGLWGLSYY